MNKTTTRAPRKATPNHFGGRTEEERAALEERQKIHVPRKLKTMLLCTVELDKNRYSNDETFVDALMLTFNHWLRDIEHERRMANALDEQAVVSRIIEAMEDF